MAPVCTAMIKVGFNPSGNVCTRQSGYCVRFFSECRGSSHTTSAAGVWNTGFMTLPTCITVNDLRSNLTLNSKQA